jgi:hypothetical protein
LTGRTQPAGGDFDEEAFFMAFQFLCPQGHLLQGDESHAGQQCQCPYCGTLFLIPQPQAAAPTGAPGYDPQAAAPPPSQPGWNGPAPDASGGYGYPPGAPAPQQAPPTYDEMTYEQAAPGEGFPSIQTGPDFGGGAASEEMPTEVDLGTATNPDIVHIECSCGQQLETPVDMLGQEAMCPFCQSQFPLRYEDSVEYRQAKEEEIERRERQLGQKWFQWSIAAAVVVVLGVIVLVVIAAS